MAKGCADGHFLFLRFATKTFKPKCFMDVWSLSFMCITGMKIHLVIDVIITAISLDHEHKKKHREEKCYQEKNAKRYVVQIQIQIIQGNVFCYAGFVGFYFTYRANKQQKLVTLRSHWPSQLVLETKPMMRRRCRSCSYESKQIDNDGTCGLGTAQTNIARSKMEWLLDKFAMQSNMEFFVVVRITEKQNDPTA